MFKILHGGEYFYQWDLGQKLIVDEGFCKVHFCNQSGDCALVTEVYEEDGLRLANVPNVLLQTTNNIRVYGVCAEGDNIINTNSYQIFRVIARGKPEGYVYTEEDVLTYEALEKRVEALESGGVAAGGVPQVVKGTMSYEYTPDNGTRPPFTDINIVINVEVDNYEAYKVGDSFLIEFINSYYDVFPIGQEPENLRINGIYIKINNLDKMLIYSTKESQYSALYLKMIVDMLVICKKAYLEDGLVFDFWNTTFWNVVSESEGELADESGFKKIGFTDDCDYVASASDGYYAFNQAIANAAEGDTILVMPGTYKGSTQLNVNKDITFIAVGDAIIDFDVRTQGGGTFSYENWEWESIEESKHSKWDGFTFNKNFAVGLECNPDNVYYNGFTTATNCVFNGSATIVGDCRKCEFYGGLYVGHYYGTEVSTFTNCIIKCYFCIDSGEDYFIGCEFYIDNSRGYVSSMSTYRTDCLQRCKFYAPGEYFIISENHAYDFQLNDSIVYANGFTAGSSSTIGGYLVRPEAI